MRSADDGIPLVGPRIIESAIANCRERLRIPLRADLAEREKRQVGVDPDPPAERSRHPGRRGFFIHRHQEDDHLCRRGVTLPDGFLPFAPALCGFRILVVSSWAAEPRAIKGLY